ncbi:MAG: nicotinate phosphoribosyltransferase [Treponema sp.]|nr:nicotinate phosphoribosyltransferase [Treponema sp.]
MEQIITSLLETDMYKFSMGQAIYHQFPGYMTTWGFKCRNEGVHFTHEMVEEIRRQVQAYCELRFTEDELNYLRGIEWIKRNYVDFLRLWHPRFEEFSITETEDGCGLSIETSGTWLNTSFYEIPTLAIVNEVYFRMAADYGKLISSFRQRADKKIAGLEDGTYALGSFSEFGLRRRLSREAQEYAVSRLAARQKECGFKESLFVGTSNVLLAKQLGVSPVGTMAHEFVQCVGQGNRKHNPAYSNWYMLESWVKEYGVLNGIALTDTITTPVFCRDFRKTYATLFSGVRHDSGDPYAWGELMMEHYKSLGIDPRTKTLLFSDSLDFERATALYRHFRDKARVAFGIGTYIANDTDIPPLNIVMKVTECNDGPVAKISDAEGKNMCKDPAYIHYLKRTIQWRLEHKEM